MKGAAGSTKKQDKNSKTVPSSETALERAVMRGVEAVEKFYATHDAPAFTAKALAIACRYAGPDTVRCLLEHGAAFQTSGADVRLHGLSQDGYESMILPACAPTVRRKQKRQNTHDETVEIIHLLHEHNAASFGEVLYQALIHKEFDIAEELISYGTVLPAYRVALITGSEGFVNPSKGIAKGDRMAVRAAIRDASDLDLMRMIDLFLQCPDVGVFAVYDLDVCSIDFYPRSSKEILARFSRLDMLKFMLEKTTMRKIVTRRMLVELMVEQNSVAGLEWLISNGFLNRQVEIKMLKEVLEDHPGHTEMMALAVAHEAAHPPKKDSLSIPTDPLAASLLRKFWKYESCGDGKQVRILSYKGDQRTVAIPPRIGRRPVTEIAVSAMLSAMRFYDSVSFPGTIATVPPCLSPARHTSNAEEIILQEGIQGLEDYAFSCTTIQSITVPDSVIHLGRNVFDGCTQLANVRLPASLKDLPGGTFRGCKSMTVLPEGAAFEKIGANAFEGTSLTRIDLSSAKELGSGAFANCTELRDVKLPPHLTVLPASVFKGCTELAEIPECPKLTAIGKEAFARSGLKQVHLGDSINQIDAGAFRGCAKLSGAVIDCGITEIPESLFDGCRSLNSIVLPSDIETVPKAAFRGCAALDSLDLPESVGDVGEEAFSGTGFTEVNIPARVKIGTKAFSSCSKLQTVSIECGSDTAAGVFQDCSALSTVVLEDGLRTIPESMFAGCTGLKKICLPDSLKKIESRAFHRSGVRRIDLGNRTEENPLEIGENAFQSSGLEEVHVDRWVQVRSSAFANCRALKKVRVSGQAALDKAVFSECVNLKEAVIEDGIKEIPQALFTGCTSLETVSIPDTVTQIGSRAFKMCGLKTVEIPSSVKHIGIEAFAGSAVERIVIPDTVESIGTGAFLKCRNLREVTLPRALQRIADQLFQGCGKLHIVTMPEQLVGIGARAFEGCRSLTGIELPDSVSDIQGWAFLQSGIENICIPPKVNVIRNRTFYSCNHLRRIEFANVHASIKGKALGGTPLAKAPWQIVNGHKIAEVPGQETK